MKIFIMNSHSVNQSLHSGQQSKLSNSHHLTGINLLIQIIEREILIGSPSLIWSSRKEATTALRILLHGERENSFVLASFMST